MSHPWARTTAMELAHDPTDLAEPQISFPSALGHQPSPPDALSPSGASTFEQCPRRWRFRYVEKLPDPPGQEALIGTFAHRVLELLLQEDPQRRTPERARELARRIWPEIEADPDYQSLDFDETAGRVFRWRAWQAIEGLWVLEDPAEVEVAATEQHLETTLAGVPFRGVLDRLDVESDGLVVTDYKSGRAPSPRYADSRLHQVLLYAAAVTESTGERPVRARLFYLGEKIIDVTVTDELLSSTVDQFESTWNSIGESCVLDEFAPRIGPLCGWCHYAELCPEGSAEVARREALAVAEEESLLRLVG